MEPIIQSVTETENISQTETIESANPAPETTVPKRRGRPPGSKNNASKPLEEKSVNSGTDQPAAKRGRPKKVDTFSAEAKERMARQVQGIHMMAAQLSGFGEFQISEPEAVMLSDAIINTSNEYGLSLSGKTGALIQLIGTAAIIYLPRFAVINAKIKAKKANQSVTIDNPAEHG